MESGWRWLGFFFADTPKRVSAVIEYARKRYPDLFDSNKSNRRNTPQASYRYIVGGTINDRHDQLCMIADYEPGKIKELEAAPIIDYYMILNSRVQAAKKQKK